MAKSITVQMFFSSHLSFSGSHQEGRFALQCAKDGWRGEESLGEKKDKNTE